MKFSLLAALTALTLLFGTPSVGAAQQTYLGVPPIPGAQPTMGQPMVAAPIPTPTVAAPLDYKLGVADRVRILVYNEPTLSGEFPVNSNGAIAVPLVGDVQAVDRTLSQLSEDIRVRLADGYLRDPKVSIDVTSFRPFYILGEVNKPGQYPYSAGLTVQNAVATAQGFTYRADKRRVYIKGVDEKAEHEAKLTSTTAVNPGDTIRIGERYF